MTLNNKQIKLAATMIKNGPKNITKLKDCNTVDLIKIQECLQNNEIIKCTSFPDTFQNKFNFVFNESGEALSRMSKREIKKDLKEKYGEKEKNKNYLTIVSIIVAIVAIPASTPLIKRIVIWFLDLFK
jgi:hypothetical protein